MKRKRKKKPEVNALFSCAKQRAKERERAGLTNSIKSQTEAKSNGFNGL